MITPLLWRVFDWAGGFNNDMFVSVQLWKTRTSSQTSLGKAEAFSWVLSCAAALAGSLTVTEGGARARLITSDRPVHSRLWSRISLETIANTFRELELFDSIAEFNHLFI